MPEPRSTHSFPSLLGKYAIIPAVFVLWGILAWQVANFAGRQNQLNVLNQNATYIILAIGMTFVIVTGGIDLSVGSTVALAGVAAAKTAAAFTSCGAGGVTIAIAAGVGTGLLLGALNALFITVGRLSPFITTLAGMTIIRGTGFILTGARPVSNLPDAFWGPGSGYTWGVPNPVYFMGVVLLVSAVLLAKTRFGRYLYAIGGNEEAARLSGLPVQRIKFAVYVLAGGLAGLAGTLAASNLGSGDPKLGSGYELVAIAAVVIGGASLNGGKGTILGTVFGALFMGYLVNGLSLEGVSQFSQDVIKGAVILVAALSDRWLKR